MAFTHAVIVLLFFSSFCLSLVRIVSAGESDSLPAKGERHLFLDPAILTNSTGVMLAVNPAQQKEIVIRHDQAWEQLMISFFLTVMEEDGKLRLWYICRDKMNRPNLAYAESIDGLNWIKPNLGIVEYDGSTENNLVGINSLEGVVFRDPYPASPDETYHYLTFQKGAGMVRYTSPDGLRWKRDAQAFLPFACDTQNVTLHDEQLGQYVVYLRGWTAGPRLQDKLRVVKRLTTNNLSEPYPIVPDASATNMKKAADLVHLGNELPTVFAADQYDPPDCDVYNISAQRYELDPRWYLGFPSFLMREKGLSNGRVEAMFAGSRDGIHWHRYDRTAYARPGLTGSESASMVFMGTGIVFRNGEIWQYGVGLHTRHGDMKPRYIKTDGAIYRFVQRIDGFVSLDFENAGGQAETIPVKVTGDQLVLNLDTGALGKIQIGLLNANGQSIPGFDLEECLQVRTNSLNAVVQWKDQPSLAAIQGQDVRLQLRGARSKLFSFRFE